MSKAFTKEDDDAGFAPPSASSSAIPAGPFRVTPLGARAIAAHPDAAVRAAMAHAEILAPSADVAVLGVTVHVRHEDGRESRYRLVSKEERALLGEGVTVDSPLGRALLGARAGDVRELRAPRGAEELEVLGLEVEA